jgi:hypothetical protein
VDFWKDFLIGSKDKPARILICPLGKDYFYSAKVVVEGAKWALPTQGGLIGESQEFTVTMKIKDIEGIDIPTTKDITKVIQLLEEDV